MTPNKVQACQVPKVYVSVLIKRLLLSSHFCNSPFLLHITINEEKKKAACLKESDPFHSEMLAVKVVPFIQQYILGESGV